MAKKGHTNNPNGRPKGIPNKSTNELRQLLHSFIEHNFKQLQVDFDALEPYQRLKMLERLLKFVLPPMVTDLSQLSESDLDILLNRLRDEQTAKN